MPIGEWVLRHRLRAEPGLADARLAARSRSRSTCRRASSSDQHLLRESTRRWRETGLAPELLELEITESMVMQNVAARDAMLDAMQSRGIHLSIDDFGTGYSSCRILKRFPIDTIKIDRSFVRDLAQRFRGPGDRAGHHQSGASLG